MPVSVHVDAASSTTLTLPVCPEGLIAPLNSELLVMFRVKLDALSIIMSPSMSWPSALRVTFPPLLPDVPQLSIVARKKHPDSSLLVMAMLPERVIVVVVLVTWKMSPTELIREPPVMVNLLEPFEASPDIDW